MRYSHAIRRLAVMVIVLLFELVHTFGTPGLAPGERLWRFTSMLGSILIFGGLLYWLYRRR